MTVNRDAGPTNRPVGDAPGEAPARTWRGALSPENRPGPRDAVEWFRDKGVTVTAAILIAVQLIWMAALLYHSYFHQDDFRFFDRALAHGFSWSYLMWVDVGHMLPLGFAIAWVMARVALYNWALTSVWILAVQILTCLALLRMLRTLFGNRPAILIPLTAYVFSALSLAAVVWWAVALEIQPLELAMFMAVDAHVRYLRSGRFRTALAAAGWLLLAMAAMDKGAVIPLLLFALTSAFFVEGRWAVAAVTALRRFWQAWLLYGALLAGYCVVFVIQLRGSTVQPGSPGTASNVVSFGSTLLGTTLVPGLLGGPWRWLPFGYTDVYPPVAIQQLSWAVAALIVIVSCWYRRHAWRAWAILLGWVAVADTLPVVIGRLGTMAGALLGIQARYATDAVAVFALCLGLAFLPLREESNAYRFQFPATAQTGSAALTGRAVTRVARTATVLVLAAFLVGSFWSLQSLESITNTGAARSYIATARLAVAQAPRGTPIVDRPTPAMIMDPVYFVPTGYTSYVIGAMARQYPDKHLSWIQSPRGVIHGLMIFDTNGQLRPAVLAGLSSVPPPRRRCWSVTTAGTSIPLQGSLFRWSWTVRLDYSGPATVLALRFGEKWADVTLPAGAHAFYVPLVGSGKEVTVRQVSPWPAQCLTGITVGTMQPATSGRAIPAAPVPG